jgi:hypothetical protein
MTDAPDKRVERLANLAGRLHGLASTVRYEMPDELRSELRQLSNDLTEATGLRLPRCPR